jgi:hypothetical protein
LIARLIAQPFTVVLVLICDRVDRLRESHALRIGHNTSDAAARIDGILYKVVRSAIAADEPRNALVPQPCHEHRPATKNPRQIKRIVVAPTGIESGGVDSSNPA